MSEEKEVRFETPEKPEIEDIKEIIADVECFEEPEKAQAIIKNLGLSIGDDIKERTPYSSYDGGVTFEINPRMVLNGNSPEHYKKEIGNLKKILTKEEIKLIDNYLKRKKEDEKVKDKIYYGITKRKDKFYWRGNIKKSLDEKTKEVLEFFKEDKFCGINNLVFHLLEKEETDFRNCYKCAWNNKPIPNIQEWREENDGEYIVLTNDEADTKANEYLTDDEYNWKCAVEAGNTTEGLEEWAESVLRYDGRGSVLNHYDGCEEYEEINGTDYYIYRTN